MVREVRRQTDNAQIHPHAHKSPTNHSGIPRRNSTGLAGSDSGLLLTVGGSAIATGDNTLATGTIQSDVKDLGRVTEAVGYASFIAAANSPSGASGAVAADTFADVTGADFAVVITRQSGPTAGSGTILSTSQTKVMAIDILAGRLQVGRSKWTSQFNRDPNEARA